MSISLAKNQTINLAKNDGGTLRNVRMGLGWDSKAVTTTKKGLFGGVKTKTVQKDVDLDASAILIGGGAVQDIVYFGHLRSDDGSLIHTGDNLTGAGDGDDESILVNLGAIPANVDTIVFTVNSYSGEKFTEIDNAYVRVVDTDQKDTEIARYELSGGEPSTALVMAKVTRSGGGWSLTAVGKYAEGRTAQQLQSIALTV